MEEFNEEVDTFVGLITSTFCLLLIELVLLSATSFDFFGELSSNTDGGSFRRFALVVTFVVDNSEFTISFMDSIFFSVKKFSYYKGIKILLNDDNTNVILNLELLEPLILN